MIKENISVSIRLRPLNRKEIKRKEKEVIQIEKNSVVIDLKSVSRFNLRGSSLKKMTGSIKSFNFNKCFCPKTKNDEIHEELSKDIVLSSLRGINSTIFVYGQTGSGKTHSITGDALKDIFYRSKSPQTKRFKSKSRSANKKDKKKKSNEGEDSKLDKIQKDGILYLSLKDIFKEVEKAKKSGEEFVIKCSYIEIYKENIYDLLRDEFQKEKCLTIYEDVKKGEFNIKNSLEEHITTYKEAVETLEKGEQNRHFAITNFNHNSSRSHTIFRIFIKYLNKEKEMFESVCNFVDLAGSEKLSRYKDEDKYDRPARIKESKSINKSLFFLTQIINLKGRNQNEVFIPYRNSPLTKILKNSIGGNAKTAIMICINPALSNLEQSLSSLNFGNLAAKIQNKVKKNQIVKPENDPALQNLLREYKNKIEVMENEFAVQNNKANYGFQNKIDLLEKNKKVMKKKYNNLLSLTQSFMNRFQKDFYVEKKFENIKNCGDVDFFVIKKGKKLNELKRIFKVNNFFEDNKDYTKQLFKEDLIISQKNKIKELQKKNLDTKILLENINYKLKIQKEKSFEIKKENLDLIKILNLFLNKDFKLLENFQKENKENLIENSLNFIENLKTDIINKKLRSFNNEFILSYKKNQNPNISIKNLRNLINNLKEKTNKEIKNKNHLNYSITFKNSKEFSQNFIDEPREFDLDKFKLERIKTDEIILEKQKDDFRIEKNNKINFQKENKNFNLEKKINFGKEKNNLDLKNRQNLENEVILKKEKNFIFENDLKMENKILEDELHSKINEDNSFISNFEFSKLIISEAKVDYKENEKPNVSEKKDMNFKKKENSEQKSISQSYLLNN